MFAISGFHREVDENRVILGYYVTRSGSSLPTFRDNISVPKRRFSALRIENLRGFAIRVLLPSVFRLFLNSDRRRDLCMTVMTK